MHLQNASTKNNSVCHPFGSSFISSELCKCEIHIDQTEISRKAGGSCNIFLLRTLSDPCVAAQVRMRNILKLNTFFTLQ